LKSQPRREALAIMQATIEATALPATPKPSEGGRRRTACDTQGAPRRSEAATATCRES
jgi:hypothetical protein